MRGAEQRAPMSRGYMGCCGPAKYLVNRTKFLFLVWLLLALGCTGVTGAMMPLLEFPNRDELAQYQRQRLPPHESSWLLFGGLLGAGCSTAVASDWRYEFPATNESFHSLRQKDTLYSGQLVERLGRLSSEDRREGSIVTQDMAAAAGWMATTEAPNMVADIPYEDHSPFDGSLTAVVAARPGEVQSSSALRCVAKEVGRFYLAKGKLPNPRLERFIVARCGSIVSSLRFASLTGTFPASVSDTEIWQQWQGAAGRLVLRVIRAGSQRAGLWFGRVGQQAILMVVAGQARIEVDPFIPSPDPHGRIRISGVLRVGSTQVDAFINHGAHGVARCQRDLRLNLPRFAIICDMSAIDRISWLQLMIKMMIMCLCTTLSMC